MNTMYADSRSTVTQRPASITIDIAYYLLLINVYIYIYIYSLLLVRAVDMAVSITALIAEFIAMWLFVAPHATCTTLRQTKHKQPCV